MENFKSKVPFIVLIIVVLLALVFPSVPLSGIENEYNHADVGWMLASTALVMFMTPGLAYFYAGIDRKSVV